MAKKFCWVSVVKDAKNADRALADVTEYSESAVVSKGRRSSRSPHFGLPRIRLSHFEGYTIYRSIDHGGNESSLIYVAIVITWSGYIRFRHAAGSKMERLTYNPNKLGNLKLNQYSCPDSTETLCVPL